MLRLRPATPDDCERLWHWANDPAVRAFSFTPAPIPWETHQAWFAKKLAAAQTTFWIVLDTAGEPIGQVRFEQESATEAEIHISLSAAQRGKGYGRQVIAQASQAYCQQRGIQSIYAWVLQANGASLRAFEQAGYQLCQETAVDGRPASQLSWRCPTVAG